jgi:hypothetical protein
MRVSREIPSFRGDRFRHVQRRNQVTAFVALRPIGEYVCLGRVFGSKVNTLPIQTHLCALAECSIVVRLSKKEHNKLLSFNNLDFKYLSIR